MGQNPIQRDKPAHPGLLIHTIITQDRVLRYSESNEFSFTDKPNVVERGAERTINIFAALLIQSLDVYRPDGLLRITTPCAAL